jgi:hypothetical protein
MFVGEYIAGTAAYGFLYSGGTYTTFNGPPDSSFALPYGINNKGQIVGTYGVTVTPLPAALPLFVTGLGVMGLFGWRKKRKPAQSAAG